MRDRLSYKYFPLFKGSLLCLFAIWYIISFSSFRNGVNGNGYLSNIEVKVINCKSNTPIAWATIFVKKNGYGSVSDKDGYCKFNFPNEELFANDTFLFSCIGFKDTSIAISSLESSRLNLVFMCPLFDEIDTFVVKSKGGINGADLIKKFKKNFSLNFPQTPGSGLVYLNINSVQNGDTARDIDYVTGFSAFQNSVDKYSSYDTVLKQKVNVYHNEMSLITNPTTRGMVTHLGIVTSPGIEELSYFVESKKVKYKIASTRKIEINGVKFYNVKLELNDPLLFTERVSVVDLELLISGIDFSIFKYKIGYKVYFDNHDGLSECINLKGKRLGFSTPQGFQYDSIVNTKEVYFKKSNNGYTPFIFFRTYRVYDFDIAANAKNSFTENRHYFVFDTDSKDVVNKDSARLYLKDLSDKLIKYDSAFWKSFFSPDKRLFREF